MNKAVLVIDMPKSCDECQLKVLDCDLYYTTYACQNVDCETEDILKTTKYEMNCPLKPLPTRAVNLEEVLHNDGMYYIEEIPPTDFDRGFNYCLDKILGEKIDE